MCIQGTGTGTRGEREGKKQRQTDSKAMSRAVIRHDSSGCLFLFTQEYWAWARHGTRCSILWANNGRTWTVYCLSSLLDKFGRPRKVKYHSWAFIFSHINRPVTSGLTTTETKCLCQSQPYKNIREAILSFLLIPKKIEKGSHVSLTANVFYQGKLDPCWYHTDNKW